MGLSPVSIKEEESHLVVFYFHSAPPCQSQNDSPTSSFFEGVSDELKHYGNCGEPEVNQPVQQARGITPEAGGPFRVSPSKPSLPTSSWFEGAEDYYQSGFGDQGPLGLQRAKPHYRGDPTKSPGGGYWHQERVGGGARKFLEQQNPHASGQPIESHAQRIEFLERKIPAVLRGCQRVAVRRDVCTRIFDDLHLQHTSPQKRLKIMEVLRGIETDREIFNKNPSLKAAYHFQVSVNDWERDQRRPPNPVDDVP